MASEAKVSQGSIQRPSQRPKKDTWFSRFLERLAAANEKQFGGQMPDCCGRMRTGSNTTIDRSKPVR